MSKNKDGRFAGGRTFSQAFFGSGSRYFKVWQQCPRAMRGCNFALLYPLTVLVAQGEIGGAFAVCGDKTLRAL
jgi:hypothetical protein